MPWQSQKGRVRLPALPLTIRQRQKAATMAARAAKRKALRAARLRVRVYFVTHGAHVHCRVFIAPSVGTFAKSGELALTSAEWLQFRAQAGIGWEFVPEPDPL